MFVGVFDRVVFGIHDAVASDSSGRKRIPCLPYFSDEICAPGKLLRVGTHGIIADLEYKSESYREYYKIPDL